MAAESSPLSISVAEDGEGVRVVALTGELDFLSASDLGARLSDLRGQTGNAVVIDVSGLTFIDSTGLATLLHGSKRTQNGEARVAIVSPEGDVRRVLELTAVDKLIRVCASLEQAVKAVQTTDA